MKINVFIKAEKWFISKKQNHKIGTWNKGYIITYISQSKVINIITVNKWSINTTKNIVND